MKTELKDGSIFKFRQHGRWMYGEVLKSGTLWMMKSISDIQAGTVVHRCKWQDDCLIVLEKETV